MARFSASSPYAQTLIIDDQYLDIITIRPVPRNPDDVEYTIESQYNHRPDLLAFDLYGNTKLWWVFAQRNMDVLQDPIYDFTPGTKIFVPQGPALRSMLGV